MIRKRSGGRSTSARTRTRTSAKIDVTTVRTRFATFAVAVSPRGIASIFPIRGAAVTAAQAGKDPWLARRIRAGAELVLHRAPRTYPPALARAAAALRAYTSSGGWPKRLDLDLEGTPFQRSVWKRLCAIPTGKTISYGALAASIGRPKAARAVGGAVGSNPVPLLIPCHRVVGENGSLTGFGLGLPMKRALLAHEGIETT
jgi:O-6-methylguanine DNA methyltransferase